MESTALAAMVLRWGEGEDLSGLAYESLKKKIVERNAHVVVVGLGYVGLPLAIEKANAGFFVHGVERNEHRVAQVLAGESYISDVESSAVRRVVETGLLTAATSFDGVRDADVIVICVPTPLTVNLVPDLQYVQHVTTEIAKNLRPGQLVSLESTTYPGTTAEMILPILSETGLTPDDDFYLVHSPERVDPGNPSYRTGNTPKVVGGIGPKSLEVGQLFYEQSIQRVIPVSDTRAAEMTKVFENTFRAVNIALVNELTILCDRMKLSVWEILDASFTKPFGIMPFYPGPGVGGNCIPIDPHYLEWKAKEYQFSTRFIALAGEVNRQMPAFVVEKAQRILNTMGRPMKASKVLVLGVAYKPNVRDYRESPAIPILQMLRAAEADVVYHDPFIPSIPLSESTRMESMELTEELLTEIDLTIITTHHDGVDYDAVVQGSKHVLDTRNALKHLPCEKVTAL